MVWLVRVKVDSTEWTEGASSVRLSSASESRESGRIVMADLRENNLLKMFPVCLSAEIKTITSVLFKFITDG